MRERALSGLETPGSGMAREVGLFQMRKQGHRYGSHRHRAPGGRLGLRSKNDYNRQTIPIRRVQTDDPKVRGASVRRDASKSASHARTPALEPVPKPGVGSQGCLGDCAELTIAFLKECTP